MSVIIFLIQLLDATIRFDTNRHDCLWTISSARWILHNRCKVLGITLIDSRPNFEAYLAESRQVMVGARQANSLWKAEMCILEHEATAQGAIDVILEAFPSVQKDNFGIFVADFGDLKQVKAATERFIASETRLVILVNNAGLYVDTASWNWTSAEQDLWVNPSFGQGCEWNIHIHDHEVSHLLGSLKRSYIPAARALGFFVGVILRLSRRPDPFSHMAW